MLYAIVAIIAVILDQVVKYLVETRVVLNAIGSDLVRLIPGVVHITNVHNLGAAFNFLQGARWLFVVICVIFVIVVIYVLARGIIRTPLARWMAIFVLAGAVGNCIDRIICGYVVDMFEFEFFRFPVFNLADIYITLGAIIFCLCILLEKPKQAAAEDGALPEDGDAPAAERAPLLRRRAKPEFPDYPVHNSQLQPGIDPNDPFAEWEKRERAADAEEAPAPVFYSQPEAADDIPDTSELIWRSPEEEAPPEEEPAPFRLHLPDLINPAAKQEPVWPAEDAAPIETPPAPAPAEDAPAPIRVELPKPRTVPEQAPIRINVEPAPKPEAPKPAAKAEPVPAAPKPAPQPETPKPAPAAPAAAKPAPAAQPVKPAAVSRPIVEEAEEEVTYNLDDILAEFRDL